MDDWAVLLFFGAFLIFGAVFVILGLMGIRRSILSEDWPRHKGTIRALPEEAGGATLEYEYWVDDQRFTSSKISLGFISADQYQAIVARLPPGTSVTAYVNPDESKEAILVPGVQRSNYVVLTVGVMFTFVGLWIGVLIWLAT